MNVRPPTMEEAVEILLNTITREERRAQLAFMREKQGDDFAEQVKRKVEAKWKKK